VVKAGPRQPLALMGYFGKPGFQLFLVELFPCGVGPPEQDGPVPSEIPAVVATTCPAGWTGENQAANGCDSARLSKHVAIPFDISVVTACHAKIIVGCSWKGQ